jgi:precorrin-8X/cobalt-precorrin-8 methylmutase
MRSTDAAAPYGSLLARYGLPPAEIERISLERIESLAGPNLPVDPGLRHVVRRMLYAVGDPELGLSVRLHPDLVTAGVAALHAGCPVIVDVAMVAAGLRGDALRRWGSPIMVAISQPNAATAAGSLGITRSAMGMRLLAEHLPGALVVIGNAPTALLELLDLLDGGCAAPAAIVGMPVGLVAAAESKDELVQRVTPYATVLGTRGGSALAAAAVNALVELAGPGPSGEDAHG